MEKCRTSYTSRTTSMTKAASSENREMRDEIAYIGTMIIIRTTILPSNVSLSGELVPDVHTVEEKA